MITDPVRLAFRPEGSIETPQPQDGGPPLDNDQAIPIPGNITFREFLQGLNPLQHVPGVGMLYRAATGTDIHPVMRVAGAGITGGPLGMATAGVMAALEAFRPVERLRAHLNGQPDPLPAVPALLPRGTDVAEAYRRWSQATV
ncbi:MAG: hypothetical protein K2X11_21270 [Acetobacteraceae bacterium]|nr:hypothetical protein [Acetobacteraceae bacterium]